VVPVVNASIGYSELMRDGLDWRWFVERALVSSVVAAGPWLALLLLLSFLADPGASARRYLAAFRVLLAMGAVAAIAWILPAAAQGTLNVERAFFALLTPALAGFGVFLGRGRLSSGRGGGMPASAGAGGVLWRNKGFLFACVIAAWLGLEVAGKGTGIIKWLFWPG
jgi:hypothetical protein